MESLINGEKIPFAIVAVRTSPMERGNLEIQAPAPIKKIKARKIEMRPILLKGHERCITHIVTSSEGDLLFTSGKDNVVMVFFPKKKELSKDKFGKKNLPEPLKVQEIIDFINI